jgi:hypothetical protein
LKTPKQETIHNTHDPTNETVEANFEGGTYFFSSAQDPSENTLVYGSTDRFALVMFIHSAPLSQVRPHSHMEFENPKMKIIS